MRRLQRLRRGERFDTEEKLNEMIDAINTALEITVGSGLEIRRTAAGAQVTLSSSMRQSGPPRGMMLFYQVAEPAAVDWLAGDWWIDSDDKLGGTGQPIYVKTKLDAGSNASKIRLGNACIWIQATEPAAADWRQGELWLDTSTVYSTVYYQLWVKTGASISDNLSKVPLTIMVAS